MPTPRLSDALGHAPADKRLDILRAVVLTGSISQAARDAAVSYKAAWQALDTLTNLAGVALVERVVGGAGGGGAVVTAAGVELLALADALNAARSQVLAAGARSSAGWLNGASLGLRTSMRNQWPCQVVRVELVGASARIYLQLGAASASGLVSLVARVTQESAELLGLAPGQTVLALCKATAVQIMAASSPNSPNAVNTLVAVKPLDDGRNRLEGTAAQVAHRATTVTAAADRRAAGSDEVTLQLAPSLQLVGFASAGVALRVGQRAVAVVAENALVVALAG